MKVVGGTVWEQVEGVRKHVKVVEDMVRTAIDGARIVTASFHATTNV